ncbi:MAG: hypothetical protein ABIJ18_00235 [archaeon]
MFIKKLWKYLLVDVSFLTIIFFLMVYAKSKVEMFFILFEGYQAQLEAIEPELMNRTIEGLLQFEQIQAQVNASVTNTYIFVIFLVPLLIYLLFALSQSLNFSLAMNKKFKFMYFLKFVLFGLPFLVALFFLFNLLFQFFSVFLYDWRYMTYTGLSLLGIIVLFYFWFFIMKEIIDKKFKLKFLEEMLKFRKSCLYYMGMVVFAIISLGFVGVLYVRYITASFYSYYFIPMILGLLLFLGISAYFKEKFLREKFI